MATIDQYIESITFKSQIIDDSSKKQAEKDKIFKMVSSYNIYFKYEDSRYLSAGVRLSLYFLK